MSAYQIDHPISVRYDGPLRFIVASFHNPHDSYVVELDAYGGNGMCACKWFETTLGPLLSKMIGPEEAIARGLIKLRVGQDPRDILRCKHILEARRIYTDDTIKAVHEAQAARADAARGKTHEAH